MINNMYTPRPAATRGLISVIRLADPVMIVWLTVVSNIVMSGWKIATLIGATLMMLFPLRYPQHARGPAIELSHADQTWQPSSCPCAAIGRPPYTCRYQAHIPPTPRPKSECYRSCRKERRARPTSHTDRGSRTLTDCSA